MIGIELVEEILGPNLVAASIDVNHDLRTRRISSSRVHARNARFDQIREVVPIVREPAIRPEHAVDDFIADLHHVRRHARLVERGYGLRCVFEHCFDQLGMRHAFPGFWEELLARIGPGVRIVVVEQKMVTQPLSVFAVSRLQSGDLLCRPGPVYAHFSFLNQPTLRPQPEEVSNPTPPTNPAGTTPKSTASPPQTNTKEHAPNPAPPAPYPPANPAHRSE